MPLSKKHPYAAVLALGAVAGMRAALAPSLVARHLRAARPLRVALGVAAAGELVGDKLPWTPDRILPGPLLGRALSGAACGVALAAGGGRASVGAVLGGAAALGAAIAGFHLRRAGGRALGAPDVALALCEDALAFLIAREALREQPRR